MTMTQVDSWFCIPSTMHFSMIKKIRHIDDLMLDDITLRRMVERVFEEFRWEVKFNSMNDIISIDFTGEQYGNDKDFLDMIAPFVENESYIELDFEDGSCARWEFDGNECNEKIGRYEKVWE